MKALTRTLFLGKVWQHYDELPSTNALMNDWLISGNNSQLNEGVLITTFNQTSGRGQMGNVWLSEPYQNIAFTILLQPNFLLAQEQFHLNKAIALAIHDFIEIYLTNPQNTEGGKKSPISPSPHPLSTLATIKWANDVYINDRKVAGILIENSLSGSFLQHSVIGIGLNINQLVFPPNLNATSLALETGRSFDLFELVERLALAIEWRYLTLKRQKNFDTIHAEYLSKLYRLDQDATFVYADGRPFRGKIVGVTEGGQLEILTAHNGLERFGIKEVKFEV